MKLYLFLAMISQSGLIATIWNSGVQCSDCPAEIGHFFNENDIIPKMAFTYASPLDSLKKCQFYHEMYHDRFEFTLLPVKEFPSFVNGVTQFPIVSFFQSDTTTFFYSDLYRRGKLNRKGLLATFRK